MKCKRPPSASAIGFSCIGNCSNESISNAPRIPCLCIRFIAAFQASPKPASSHQYSLRNSSTNSRFLSLRFSNIPIIWLKIRRTDLFCFNPDVSRKASIVFISLLECNGGRLCSCVQNDLSIVVSNNVRHSLAVVSTMISEPEARSDTRWEISMETSRNTCALSILVAKLKPPSNLRK